LLSLLAEYDLLKKGIVSWWFNQTSRYNTPNTTYKLPKIGIINTAYNDDFPLDELTSNIFLKHQTLFNKNFIHDAIDSEVNNDRWNLNFCKKSFLQITCETTFSYPRPYISEKTIRNFLLKRPFIIVGSPGTIFQLQKLGFKTFNDFWNESYDLDKCHLTRLQKIFKIVKDICSKDIDELQNICYNMSDILEYNANHYITYYANKRLETLFND